MSALAPAAFALSVRHGSPCIAVGLCAALALLTGCGRHPPEMSVDARALCHGEPLGSIEKRNQAQEDGYEVNRRYDCITKESFAAVARQQAEWQAAHTPQAIAAREKEFAAQRARGADMLARAREAEQRERDAPLMVDVSPVEANSASQDELEQMTYIDAELATQIVAARSERPFRDWADLSARVVGLGAAQTAVHASVSGLVVNGESLAGMPPDARMAAELQRLYRR